MNSSVRGSKLVSVLAQFSDIPPTFDRQGFLKQFPKCRISGVLEGSLFGIFIDQIDYCGIVGGSWCFDGLMRCPCRPGVTPVPRDVGMTQIDPPILNAK